MEFHIPHSASLPSSSSTSFLQIPSESNFSKEMASTSSLTSTMECLGPKKKQKRERQKVGLENLDEVLNKWKEKNAHLLESSDNKSGRKRVLRKGAVKGCMKGKGGPENLSCKYKGVRQRTWGKWTAEIRTPDGGPRFWLGTYDSAYEAALAFDKAARVMYGPNAVFNIPEAFNLGDSSSSVAATPLSGPAAELQSGSGAQVLVEIEPASPSTAMEEPPVQPEALEIPLCVEDYDWMDQILFNLQSMNQMISIEELLGENGNIPILV